jgi:hypothetical protein
MSKSGQDNSYGGIKIKNIDYPHSPPHETFHKVRVRNNYENNVLSNETANIVRASDDSSVRNHSSNMLKENVYGKKGDEDREIMMGIVENNPALMTF